MNKVNKFSTLSRLLLVSTLFLPVVSMSQQPVIDSTVNSSVTSVNSSVGTVNSTLETGLGVSNGTSYLQNIWNHMDGDFKNKDVARAIINWEAANAINEYQYKYELLFMAAPGSLAAIQAGHDAGGNNIAASALASSNTAFLGMSAPYTVSSNLTGLLGSSKSGSFDPGTMYDSDFNSYIMEGNTNSIAWLNPARLLFSNVVVSPNNPLTTTQTNAITTTDTQKMITALTVPFPLLPAEALSAFKSTNGKFDGASAGNAGLYKEQISTAIIQNSVLGMSASALSDIVARRTPPSGQPTAPGAPAPKSIMQIMDQQSTQRFSDPAWYKEVGAASDTALLRELAHMQAYNIWVQYQQFRVQEQQMALLATMNAMMTKFNQAMDQMNVQLQQAQAVAKQAAAQAQQAAEEAQQQAEDAANQQQ